MRGQNRFEANECHQEKCIWKKSDSTNLVVLIHDYEDEIDLESLM